MLTAPYNEDFAAFYNPALGKPHEPLNQRALYVDPHESFNLIRGWPEDMTGINGVLPLPRWQEGTLLGYLPDGSEFRAERYCDQPVPLKGDSSWFRLLLTMGNQPLPVVQRETQLLWVAEDWTCWCAPRIKACDDTGARIDVRSEQLWVYRPLRIWGAIWVIGNCAMPRQPVADVSFVATGCKLNTTVTFHFDQPPDAAAYAQIAKANPPAFIPCPMPTC